MNYFELRSKIDYNFLNIDFIIFSTLTLFFFFRNVETVAPTLRNILAVEIMPSTLWNCMWEYGVEMFCSRRRKINFNTVRPHINTTCMVAHFSIFQFFLISLYAETPEKINAMLGMLHKILTLDLDRNTMIEKNN